MRDYEEIFGKNTALEGIEGLESWFNKIGTPTRLNQFGLDKTTLTKMLSESLGWKAQYEGLDQNPYINDFYRDMLRWSFNLHKVPRLYNNRDYIDKLLSINRNQQ